MIYDLSKLDKKKSGEGTPILFLHGWGANKNTFNPLIEQLNSILGKDKIQVHSFSFPGFGDSPEPSSTWGVDEYAQITEKYLNSFIGTPWEQGKLIVIAHSFGGRVIAKLAAKHNNFSKIILIGSAGIKPKRSIDYYVKVYFFKSLKFLASIPILGQIFKRPMEAYRKINGSSDYKSASSTMKSILSKVVNQDQTKDFKSIKTPSLLIWGEQDSATPISDGKLIEKYIKNSAMVTIDNCGHFVYLEKPNLVASIICEFINDDKAKNMEASNA